MKKNKNVFIFLCCSYGVAFQQTFNPDIHPPGNPHAEITPRFCLDLSLITPAFGFPAPTYTPCGGSHLSLLTPGTPPWPNRQLFVLGEGGGVKPLSRLLLIGPRCQGGGGHGRVIHWHCSLYCSILWYSCLL